MDEDREALCADDQTSPSRDRKHPAGIARALALFSVLTVAAIVPYLIPETLWPDVARLEAYRDGDRVPFAKILDFRPMTTPSIGGVRGETERRIEDTAELLEVAPLPEPVAIDPAPVRDDDDPLRIDPAAYEGITQTIEDPHGAMAPFYDRLRSVASGDRTLARIALYTDSINASDRISSELRSEFASRFGDGGKGFVPIAPGWQSQLHRDVEWQPEGGWSVEVVNRGDLADGRYGLAGVRAENRSQLSRVTFGTVDDGVGSLASRFDLYYQAYDGGGSFTIGVDDGESRTIATGGALEDRVESISFPEGSHEVVVRVGEGRVRLYGAVLEREGPGVVVDGLMLVGAFTRVLGHYDEPHWAATMQRRGTDLAVFWLGENDAVVEQVPFVRASFVEAFTNILRASKSEDRGCLVVSVLDSASSENGVIRSTRRVPGIVEAQRESALAAGCAFWNAYEATGGNGTARRWYGANPRLISGDFRHLTGEGARVVGTLLYRAVLYGYDQHLAAR